MVARALRLASIPPSPSTPTTRRRGSASSPRLSPRTMEATRPIESTTYRWFSRRSVAAISRQVGKDLLPSIEAERDLVKRTVDQGAVDGMSTKSEYRVDGFSLEENSQTVSRLHDLLAQHGLSS